MPNFLLVVLLIVAATSLLALFGLVTRPRCWPLYVAIWVTAAAPFLYLPVQAALFPLGPAAGPLDGATGFLIFCMLDGMVHMILISILLVVLLEGLISEEEQVPRRSVAPASNDRNTRDGGERNDAGATIK